MNKAIKEPAYTNIKYGLDPIVSDTSHIIVLGSLPSDRSLELRQYYANPTNQFWTIIGKVFDEELSSCYETRISFLHSQGIALWDVLKLAERKGSLDGNIKNGEPNDFTTFFLKYPKLRTVVFNGRKAEEEFKNRVQEKIPIHFLTSHDFSYQPSTSAAPGKHVLLLEAKVEKWKIISQADKNNYA